MSLCALRYGQARALHTAKVRAAARAASAGARAPAATAMVDDHTSSQTTGSQPRAHGGKSSAFARSRGSLFERPESASGRSPDLGTPAAGENWSVTFPTTFFPLSVPGRSPHRSTPCRAPELVYFRPQYYASPGECKLRGFPGGCRGFPIIIGGGFGLRRIRQASRARREDAAVAAQFRWNCRLRAGSGPAPPSRLPAQIHGTLVHRRAGKRERNAWATPRP